MSTELATPNTGTPSKPSDVVVAGSARFAVLSAQKATAMPNAPL
jgi:hypothetical protein